MMLVVSAPFQDDIFLTYVAGCVGATLLEYVTGTVTEALFRVRYWDYSGKFMNLQGQICLSSTIAWGFLTILMTEVIHKPVEGFVEMLPAGVLSSMTLVLTMYVSADFALSFKAALDMREALSGLEAIKREMERMQKRLDVLIAVADQALMEEREELHGKFRALHERHRQLSTLNFYKRRLLLDNPGMISARFRESMEELKEAAKGYIPGHKKEHKEESRRD